MGCVQRLSWSLDLVISYDFTITINLSHIRIQRNTSRALRASASVGYHEGTYHLCDPIDKDSDDRGVEPTDQGNHPLTPLPDEERLSIPF